MSVNESGPLKSINELLTMFMRQVATERAARLAPVRGTTAVKPSRPQRRGSPQAS
jgi:hypothetical protein